MKNLKDNKMAVQDGFSTLELLIAFAVMILALTAVILVAYGNQTMAVDTELAQRAVYIAEKRMEDANAVLKNNLQGIGTNSSVVTYESIDYNTDLAVDFASQCSREVRSTVSWNRGLQPLSTSLSTIVVDTDIAYAIGGTCSAFPPSDDWDTPEQLGEISPSIFDGQGTGIALSQIDGTRYAVLTTDSGSGDNFYVIDTSDPENIDSDDIVGYDFGTSGFNDIAVAQINGGTYAFVLDDANTNQLHVINLSNPNNPSVVATQSIPNLIFTCTPASAPCLAGRTIAYYDERIFIGTQYFVGGTLPEENNELHIYDVSNPSSPSWTASIDVNRNVNDIMVFNDRAYVATGPGTSAPYTPFRIYDVDPDSGEYLDELDAFVTTDDNAGTAVHMIEEDIDDNGTDESVIYLGTERPSSGDNFFIIDGTDPENITELVAEDTGDNTSEIEHITAQGRFVFMGIADTGVLDTFQVWNTVDKTAPWRINVCMAGSPQPQNMTAMQYDDNLIFGAFRSNAAFRVIYDTEDVCTP